MTPAMLLRNFRVIAFRPVFVEITGSIKAALLLSQALYHQEKAGVGNKWHKTYESWQIETGLTRHELDMARELCKGLLPSERKGMPPKSYYWLNLELLASKLSETGITAGTDSVPSSCPPAGLPRYENRTLTNTSTIDEQGHTKKNTADDPIQPQKRDKAIVLVRDFEQAFPTYKKKRTLKEVQKELQAADALLHSIEASEVIRIAQCCAADTFPPSRGRASNLQTMFANLEKLRSVYPAPSSGLATSIYSQKPTGQISYKLPGVPLLTYREALANWNIWVAGCKARGADPHDGVEEPLPPEDGNWDVPMKREGEL